MPLVKISSDLQLWYTSNAPGGDASNFDHSRATILLFHPFFFDSTWLRQQFQDPRLCDKYNLIAFDARSSGQTRSKVTPLRDAWVDAADVGVALEFLAIQRCHIFASQTIAVHAACCFGLLFPEKTLSICLCQLPSIESEITKKSYLELLESFCFPSSLEGIEQACVELGYLMFNEGLIPVELEDEVYAWWQMNFPATKRTKFLEIALTCLGRGVLTNAQMKRLTMPVLVMQGEKYVVNSVDHAEADTARMPNSNFFVIKGGPEAFTIVPSCATVVNRVYSAFLSRIPTPTPLPPAKPRKEKAVLTQALQNLAEIFADPKIAKRKSTSLSFSMNTTTRTAENTRYIVRFAKGEKTAITALDKTGQPVRK